MRTKPSVYAAIACALALGLSSVAPAHAAKAKEKSLYSFKAGDDGAFPQGNVVIDAQRNIFGVTESGGGAGCGGGGCGVVFKLARGGSETVLHAFQAGDDGAFPIAGPVMDAAGNLYGATLNGGAHCGCGTIYKITPDGAETVVYAFRGGKDGASPLGQLAIDAKGNLYGTTSAGGVDCNGFGVGCGTVFEFEPATGKHKVLHSFAGGGGDGVYPAAGVTPGKDGAFYGTTANGGLDCDGTGQGCGVVYRVTAKGDEKVLYAFAGGGAGAYPAAGVAIDGDGALWGTTNNGGVDCDGSGAGCGVAYKLAQDGTETSLHVFKGGDDGAYPRATPYLDGQGNAYATTAEGGGANDGGVVFRIDAGGKEQIVYSFQGGEDGGGPFSGLTADAVGDLYGTTFAGGAFASGAVYRLKLR
ncbi:MAG TPA: choice-of-anchor tandem repeat GloVer-containing protein [Rhizomicrobium sp.]|nr:choice-of-anchor tandem repeat GloVer-containing protein [Rhizomicrobium sp.]